MESCKLNQKLLFTNTRAHTQTHGIITMLRSWKLVRINLSRLHYIHIRMAYNHTSIHTLVSLVRFTILFLLFEFFIDRNTFSTSSSIECYYYYETRGRCETGSRSERRSKIDPRPMTIFSTNEMNGNHKCISKSPFIYLLLRFCDVHLHTFGLLFHLQPFQWITIYNLLSFNFIVQPRVYDFAPSMCVCVWLNTANR